MIALPVTHAKYAFSFIGAPADDAARALTLASNGPLLVATDHIMSVMLPGSLERHAHAPRVAIKIDDILGAFVAGALLADDLVGCGMHFALGVTRTAQFCKDLDEAGIDKTPVTGTRQEAWLTVKERIVELLKTLPAAMRTIARADVFFDGADNNPNSTYWYDHVTPQMLMSGGYGPEAVAQWLEVVPNAISAANA